MYIAIAGNLGSGKTTIAKLLAKKLAFNYIPQKRDELDYINDFFNDIPKFFLTTQLVFLVNKVYQIEECIKDNVNIVLDRSLYEDISIFAKLWTEIYKIDAKEKSLYNRISQLFLNITPIPDIIIYIKCSSATSSIRIENRGKREFEVKYPHNHVEVLHEKYERLISDLVNQNRSIILSIDSEKYDFNDVITQEEIIDELLKKVQSHDDEEAVQLSFWDEKDSYSKSSNVEAIHEEKIVTLNRPYSGNTFNIIKYSPLVYIAAPFTAYAIIDRKMSDELSFGIDDIGYGLIPKKYKNTLISIEKVLCKKFNISTLLPHRDINAWGKKEIPSIEVLKNLISSLQKSNFVVAIPSNSFGVHIELGIALARCLPMIVFEVEELQNSFFVSSFKTLTNCLYLKVAKISQVAKKLDSYEAIEFMKKYFEERLKPQ